LNYSSKEEDSMTFPIPNYDSTWISIAQGDTIILTHNLGGNADNYVVDLESKSTGAASGFGFGCMAGLVVKPAENVSLSMGVYWCQLTNSSIAVVRSQQDVQIEYIRIRIWKYTPPLKKPSLNK
jgi:hypothetical protein